MRDTDWIILDELHKNPNITKVAAKLYITQPTLTKRLQAMEEEFQVRIVNRSTKGVEFTPEDGQVFAWLEEKDYDHSMNLHLLNLETGTSFVVSAGAGEYVRPVGFILSLQPPPAGRNPDGLQISASQHQL